MSSTFDPSEPVDSWDRVANELRALRRSHHEAYGDIDNASLGRYLAGEADADELASIENALGDHPELRLLTDLVRDVLSDTPPVSFDPLPLPAPSPKVLPMRPKSPRRWWQQRGAAVAAAACLFVVLGAGMPPMMSSGGTEPSVALVEGMASRDVPMMVAGMMEKAPERPRPMARPAALPRGVRRDEKVADARPEAARQAFYLMHAGTKHQHEGEYDKAAHSFEQAHRICEANVGPYHPTTTAVGMKMAGVYGHALCNGDPAKATKLGMPPPPAPLPGGPDRMKKHYPEAELRARIAGKTVAEAQARMVPVLSGAMKSAHGSEARKGFVAALSELGPAAAPAVAELADRLGACDDPTEVTAIIDALGRIGPAARTALPVLEGMAGDKADRVHALLVRLRGPEGRVGVVDGAGIFTVGGVREAIDHARTMCGTVEVLVETRRPGPPADPARRLEGMGSRAVIVSVQHKSVKVAASPALRKAGFKPDAVVKAMETALKAGQADRALSEALATIERAAK